MEPRARAARASAGAGTVRELDRKLNAMEFLTHYFDDGNEDPEAMRQGRVQISRTIAVAMAVLIGAYLMSSPAPFAVTYKLLPVMLTGVWGASTDLESPVRLRMFAYLLCIELTLIPLHNILEFGPDRAIEVCLVTIADLVPLFAGVMIDRIAVLQFCAVNILVLGGVAVWSITAGTLPEQNAFGMDPVQFVVNGAVLLMLRTVLMGLFGSSFHFWVKTILTELADTAATRRRVISNLVRR